MRFVLFASFVICLLVPSSAVAQGPASLQADQLTASFLKTVTPQTFHPSRNADGTEKSPGLMPPLSPSVSTSATPMAPPAM